MFDFMYKVVLFELKFDKNSNQNRKIVENWLQNHSCCAKVVPSYVCIAVFDRRKRYYNFLFIYFNMCDFQI